MLLSDNANPTAVILVGAASTGKTTVASFFEEARVKRSADDKSPDLLCYRSDKFTPAAFVSQAANRTSQQLNSVDLLPKIKDRVLLTPELAPIFRGDNDALTKTFSVITRVLDGQGLVTDSGTHGQRGSRGEHLFAWIGCTTPLPEQAWRIMGQLGSRLFFLLLETAGLATTVDELLAMTKSASYTARRNACKAAVSGFLAAVFAKHQGLRSVAWDVGDDDEVAQKWLARCALLLSAMRNVPIEQRDEKNRRAYRPGDQEAPYRALSVLTNVARGHALVHGRQQVTMADIPLIVQVTASSMPGDPARLLRALVESSGTLSVAEVEELFGVKHLETARDRMRYVDALGVMEFHEEGAGKAAALRFGPDWAWCESAEFRDLLLATQSLPGEPVTPGGVCSPEEPVISEGVCSTYRSNNLAEHPTKKEKEVEDGAENSRTHPRENDRLMQCLPEGTSSAPEVAHA